MKLSEELHEWFGALHKGKVLYPSTFLGLAEKAIVLEAELLKFRRLDIAWGEQSKEYELEIANLKEELEHLHSRFDRMLDDALKESE